MDEKNIGEMIRGELGVSEIDYEKIKAVIRWMPAYQARIIELQEFISNLARWRWIIFAGLVAGFFDGDLKALAEQILRAIAQGAPES